jgi:DNA helicase-2/ATP-dependent DNA helicase PcrA
VDELRLAEAYEEKEGPKGETRGENVREFVSAIADFEERNPGAALAEFLSEISLLTDIDAWEENEGAVTLMTLHNSKGLEFPCVFITGIEEGLLPHLLSTGDEGEIEEERRLFYVGLTRARDKVYLTLATSRLRYGEVAPAVASRFLAEIPDHLLDEGISPATRVPLRRLRDTPEKEGVFPDYENESQEAPSYGKGARIRHAVWGEGEVTLVEGVGADAKLTIRFVAGFTKKVLVRYAVIERA